MRKLACIVSLAVITLAALVQQTVTADVEKEPPPAEEYLLITATNRHVHVLRCGHFTPLDADLVGCGELDIIRLSDMHRMEADGSWSPIPIS